MSIFTWSLSKYAETKYAAEAPQENDELTQWNQFIEQHRNNQGDIDISEAQRAWLANPQFGRHLQRNLGPGGASQFLQRIPSGEQPKQQKKWQQDKLENISSDDRVVEILALAARKFEEIVTGRDEILPRIGRKFIPPLMPEDIQEGLQNGFMFSFTGNKEGIPNWFNFFFDRPENTTKLPMALPQDARTAWESVGDLEKELILNKLEDLVESEDEGLKSWIRFKICEAASHIARQSKRQREGPASAGHASSLDQTVGDEGSRLGDVAKMKNRKGKDSDLLSPDELAMRKEKQTELTEKLKNTVSELKQLVANVVKYFHRQSKNHLRVLEHNRQTGGPVREESKKEYNTSLRRALVIEAKMSEIIPSFEQKVSEMIENNELESFSPDVFEKLNLTNPIEWFYKIAENIDVFKDLNFVKENAGLDWQNMARILKVKRAQYKEHKKKAVTPEEKAMAQQKLTTEDEMELLKIKPFINLINTSVNTYFAAVMPYLLRQFLKGRYIGLEGEPTSPQEKHKQELQHRKGRFSPDTLRFFLGMMPVWHGYQQADPNYGPAFIEMTKARPHRTRGEFVLNEDMALRDLPDEESIFKDIHFRKPWLKNRSSNNLVMLMKRFWKAANRIEELESLNDKFSKFASVSLIDDMINREIADFDAFASIFEQ